MHSYRVVVVESKFVVRQGTGEGAEMGWKGEVRMGQGWDREWVDMAVGHGDCGGASGST